MTSLSARLVVLTAILAAATGYRLYAMEPEDVPLRRPLSQMSLELGRWQGRDYAPFTKEIVDILGVDEYISRVYRASPAEVAALYVGYYQSQRNGDTIHSPMNCLPGAGWLPIETTYTDVVVPNRATPITVKRVLIQKGLDKQLVLYWYQSHGRVIGGEYQSKILMVYDAVRLNRSDAALVRVVTPIGAQDTVAQADARAVDFVQALFTTIDEHLPL
jgi:EpsI family protein